VDALLKPGPLVKFVALVGAAVGTWLVWNWVVCRVEVPPGHFLVKIHLWGKDLPEGEILAPDENYKGVLEKEFQEGRYFLNPLVWSYEIHEMVKVPAGKCLVLTRRFGEEIPAERRDRGEFLAAEGERGIVPEVRQPGNYRINPYAYTIEEVPATEIHADEVGVLTLRIGKDPHELVRDKKSSPYVVPEGYRGVQEKPLSNGTHYVNPYVKQIAAVNVGNSRVELTDIEFPSRDGFSLKPHIIVTYRVVPARAPELLVTISDEGELHQGLATTKEQEKNETLQKIILPLVRGYVRIEGSKFDARDFVSRPADGGPKAEVPRERLQQEVLKKIQPRCQEFGLNIESVSIDRLDVPPELATIIAEREQARITVDKNTASIGQYQEQQKLKAKEALKQQEEEKVTASSKLVQAVAKSKQRKATEEARLRQELDNAQLRLDAAKEQAKAVHATGKAEADVILLQNEAEVSGLRKAVQGFPTADHYAQYHVLTKLAPALGEIFASDTSEFAKLFAIYLAPPTRPAAAPAAAAAGGPATAATGGPAVGKK
jgi:regulator of protease activity HflC (stomatin/prohibitin superfamily)